MNPTRRQLLTAATGLFLAFGAQAQSFPSKPIRIVVPFAAGSGSDVYARLIAEDWRQAFGQPVIVDNKAGASAQIGTGHVAKSAPDGYTLLVATNTGHSANSALFKKLPYDPVADFTAIGRVLYMPYLLVVPKDSPFRTVAQLVDHAKAKPGVLSYAYGNSSGQVAGAEFLRQAGAKATGVAYKSMPPAMNDLIGGQVDYLFSDVGSALPQLQGGRIRALGFSLDKRSPQLPEVPSITETPGLQNFSLTSWVGIVGPAGMPADVVDKLSTQLRRTLEKPEIRDKLSALGAEVVPSTPAELDAFIKEQLVSWGTKIRNAGIQPE